MQTYQFQPPAFSVAPPSDGGVRSPGLVNGLNYNQWTPAAAGFPAVGQSYADPLTGKAVLRLTNIGARTNLDDIYDFHYANCNGSRCFARVNGADWDILDAVTGTIQRTAQPDGSSRGDCRWDMVNPDVYYFYSGASLMARNVAAGTSATKKTFPATLQPNGGSVNTQSADGRYFLVRYGGAGHIWDSQLDMIYSDNIPVAGDALGITADGAFAWGSDYTPGIIGNGCFKSFVINHPLKTVDTAGVRFWDTGGGASHGTVVSAPNGKNYLVTFNENESTIVAAELGVNRGSMTAAQLAASAMTLFAYNDSEDGAHFSTISKGPSVGWAFVTLEALSGDPFNGPLTFNRPYKQEVLAVNVVTGAVARLAHHRSRGISSNYQCQPRVSSSADGSMVLWASNFNDSTPNGYADLYGIRTPL